MASKKKSSSDSTQPPISPERLKAQASIRELFGTVQWEGDLSQMRESRFPADFKLRRTLQEKRRLP